MNYLIIGSALGAVIWTIGIGVYISRPGNQPDPKNNIYWVALETNGLLWALGGVFYPYAGEFFNVYWVASFILANLCLLVMWAIQSVFYSQLSAQSKRTGHKFTLTGGLDADE